MKDVESRVFTKNITDRRTVALQYPLPNFVGEGIITIVARNIFLIGIRYKIYAQ